MKAAKASGTDIGNDVMEVLLALVACLIAVLALALLVSATRRVRMLEDQLKRALASHDAEESTAEARHIKHRWLSFRLRTLLLLIGIAGCLLGWFVSELQRAERQRVAVSTFENFGAEITYNFDVPAPEVCFPSDRRPALPRWTRQLFGDDFGGRVLSIQFQAPVQGFGYWQSTPGFEIKSYALTDDDLASFRDLPDLTNVKNPRYGIPPSISLHQSYPELPAEVACSDLVVSYAPVSTTATSIRPSTAWAPRGTPTEQHGPRGWIALRQVFQDVTRRS